MQLAVSEYEGALSLAAFLPRVLFALAAGAWSDRHGRRPVIALPVFGQFLLNASFVLNCAFMEELPFEVRQVTSVASSLQ